MEQQSKPLVDWHRGDCRAVLDTFGGAGTVALVAHRLGRRAISIEIDPEASAQGLARIESETPLLLSNNPGRGMLPDDEEWEQAVLIHIEDSFAPKREG